MAQKGLELSAIYNRIIVPFGECCLDARISSCTIRNEALSILHQLGSLRLNNVKIHIQSLNLQLKSSLWCIRLYRLSVATSVLNALSVKANDPILTGDFDIKRIVLFSGICEITIIKQTKCYL